MRQSKVMAACGMVAALSVVIMLIGGMLGLGMYLSPLIAGMLLLPIGRSYGTRYQWMLWAAVSILCFILVPGAEQNLMYLCIFGPYPILHPFFQRLPGRLRLPCKLLYFNIVIIAVETLVTLVLVPEVVAPVMAVVMLLMFNVIFLLYDFLIPRYALVLQRYLDRLKRR